MLLHAGTNARGCLGRVWHLEAGGHSKRAAAAAASNPAASTHNRLVV